MTRHCLFSSVIRDISRAERLSDTPVMHIVFLLIDSRFCIKTAEYCDSIGVDRLSFCPATIHGGTLIERFWRKGAYQPPWIWSCIEIINTVRSKLDISSLLDTSGFGSRRGPYNCKKCNKDLKHLIIAKNLTQELIEYDCECKSEWLAEINNADMNYSNVEIKHLPLY